nr:hypothetical protein [Kibdelosporangium sp. MJ126-NF4]CEL17504.1 hypothetical protein [Kibdelosporangium sp. MJ126-NF4]
MTPSANRPVARLRQIGAGVWILAAVLASVGSFMPLLEQGRGRSRPTVALTLWGIGGNDSPIDVFPPMGIPVVFSAVVLVVAALLGLASTGQSPASGAVLATRLIGTGGAGLLVGSLAQVFLVHVVAKGPFGEDPQFVDAGYGSSIGVGVWVLMVSGLLAIAAVILMLVPMMAKRSEELATPAMGIPVVRVLEPVYDEQPATEAEQRPTDPTQ